MKSSVHGMRPWAASPEAACWRHMGVVFLFFLFFFYQRSRSTLFPLCFLRPAHGLDSVKELFAASFFFFFLLHGCSRLPTCEFTEGFIVLSLLILTRRYILPRHQFEGSKTSTLHCFCDTLGFHRLHKTAQLLQFVLLTTVSLVAAIQI